MVFLETSTSLNWLQNSRQTQLSSSFSFYHNILLFTWHSVNGLASALLVDVCMLAKAFLSSYKTHKIFFWFCFLGFIFFIIIYFVLGASVSEMYQGKTSLYMLLPLFVMLPACVF